MTSPWFSRAKLFVPPILPAAVRRFRAQSAEAIRFTGDYQTWQAAQAASDGYDDAAILERVRSSTALARDGKVAFERDGVTFDEPDYNFPLLACLLRIASENGNRLRVLDFGGALGSTYFQCRSFFSGLTELRWTVVEQPHFVACGQREFADGRLLFAPEIDQREVDVVLLSSVMQYLPEPWTLLEKCRGTGAPWLLVDRTGLIESPRDVLSVQQVPAVIYGKATRYPAWLFSRLKWHANLAEHWNTVCELPGRDGILPSDRGEVHFGFWLYHRKEGE